MLNENIIAKIYALGKLWKEQDGDFVVSSMFSNFHAAVTTTYSRVELVAIHPRLFDAAKCAAVTHTQFQTSQVVDNLKRLYCDFQFESIKGELIRMYEVADIKFTTDNVLIEGYGYVYNDSFDELKDMDPLSTQSIPVTVVYINKTWMSKMYPGWEAQLRFSSELGMAAHESLLSVVQSVNADHIVSIPKDLSL